MFTIFCHGFLLALGLILPLGAQNMFIFQQGVVQKRVAGVLPAILTAAACDTLLILLAVSGISAAVREFAMVRDGLLIAGILFLVCIGVSNWRAAAPQADGAATLFRPRRQILFAVSVSLFNPAAFLDILAVIGMNSMQYTDAAKMVFTLATITVSWMWFFMLGLLGRYVGSLANVSGKLALVNKVSSVLMFGMAVYLSRMFFAADG